MSEHVNLPVDNQTIEVHLLALFEKVEALKNEYNSSSSSPKSKTPVQIEIRTLEFWRSIICECLSSFVYVFVVCGASASTGNGASVSSILLITAIAGGFAMTTLTQCFGHISGAHINPAVSLAKCLTKKITLLRAVLYITAQCGGAIAGAAFLYGVTIFGYHSNSSAAIPHVTNVSAWERLGVEFILTFVVVLTYLVSMETYRRWSGSCAIIIGTSYSACTFVSMPHLNPARSLGPSFVLSRWENHWVYWLGPTIGGIAAGLLYEYVLNAHRHKRSKASIDGDSSSMHSDEDAYDDLDKPVDTKFHTYRSTGQPTSNAIGGYCPSVTSTSLYSAPPTKLDRVESLYGGTKSLYCKSPPLTRANLNRSQSLYAKSNNGANRDVLPRPGPLVPAQSLYPMRLNQMNQQNHVQNQNVQNQMQQRSESVYGVRGVTPRTDNYSSVSSDRGGYTVFIPHTFKSDKSAKSRVEPNCPKSDPTTFGERIWC